MNESEKIIAQAFNAWQDDYLNNPDKFEQMATTIQRHLAERAEGVEPTYGEWQVATLNAYVAEVKAAA